MPETLFATMLPALLPALLILAFRTLCTLGPPPVPAYGVIGRHRDRGEQAPLPR